MKLFDRQAVDETSPKVYIGRRIFINRRGEEQIANTWFAESTLAGRTHYSALKTASKSVAIHRAHQFAEKLRTTGGTPPRRQIELSELARQYLTMQTNRGRTSGTLEKYEYVLAAFVAWASVHFRHPAAQFTDTHFWQWNKSMIDDGYAAKTRADRLVTVKQLFKWAARQKLIESNPLEDQRVVDPPATRQPCFEPEQVQALMDAAADDLERTIFAALAFTGMRFGELRDLRWMDVSIPADRPGHILICRGGSEDTPKDGDSRRVPLHAELRGLLNRLPRRGELVFYSPPCNRHPEGGRPLNESTWLKRLKAACNRCGFAQPQQYKLHTFRHAFASMCARNNVAFRYALAWMGHSSSEILDLYFKQFDSAADIAISTITYRSPGQSSTAPSASTFSESSAPPLPSTSMPVAPPK